MITGTHLARASGAGRAVTNTVRVACVVIGIGCVVVVARSTRALAAALVACGVAICVIQEVARLVATACLQPAARVRLLCTQGIVDFGRRRQ